MLGSGQSAPTTQTPARRSSPETASWLMNVIATALLFARFTQDGLALQKAESGAFILGSRRGVVGVDLLESKVSHKSLAPVPAICMFLPCGLWTKDSGVACRGSHLPRSAAIFRNTLTMTRPTCCLRCLVYASPIILEPHSNSFMLRPTSTQDISEHTTEACR